jgi:hypothetical protein
MTGRPLLTCFGAPLRRLLEIEEGEQAGCPIRIAETLRRIRARTRELRKLQPSLSAL